MKKKIFAIGISEHRIWGLILLPMMINKNADDNFFTIDQIVFPTDTNKAFQSLSHTEREIVKIIDQYNDGNLFKLFSKEKSVKIFQEKVTPEKVDKFIRPYIEKRIARIFDILKDSRIRIFEREKSRNNIFEEDFLEIIGEPAEPIFNYYKTDEGSKYSMELRLDGEVIPLSQLSTEIYSNQPALIKVGDKILYVRDIEAQKIKPFFKSDFIEIPPAFETKFFKSFLLKLVKSYEVKAHGFEINTIIPEIITSITLEKGIDNNAVMVLRFSYGKKTLLSNSNQKVFVDFHQEKGNFSYDKFVRDEIFEESVRELLLNMGLISFDEANFEIKANRRIPFLEQLNDMVEWLNTHKEELDEANINFIQKVEEKEYFSEKVQLHVSDELKIDWFDINIEVEVGEFKIPFAYFRKHILENIREYVLPDGKIFVIPRQWFARFREMFEFAKIKDETITLHKQHFLLVEKLNDSDYMISYEQLEKLNSREGFSRVSLPKGLTAELRPYQLEGFTWLYYLQQNNLGGCLADDMGLGKTVQTITLLQKIKEEYKPVKIKEKKKKGKAVLLESENETRLTSLIIVPASLVFNWQKEIMRFAPGMKVHAFTGNQRAKSVDRLTDYDVIISTYSTVRIDIDLLAAINFHTIILDESQVIKIRLLKLIELLIC